MAGGDIVVCFCSFFISVELEQGSSRSRGFGIPEPILSLRRRLRLAGAERGSRVAQVDPNVHCGRVRATKHASRSPFRVLEDIHGLAEIVERGGRVRVERPRVTPPHLQRDLISLSEYALRHRDQFAQQ